VVGRARDQAGAELARERDRAQPLAERGPARAHSMITTTLPCALRSASMRMASPARASGKRAEMYGLILPSTVQRMISAKCSWLRLGLRAVNAPQNTPWMSQLFKSV